MLILHCGAQTVSRDELAQVSCPEPTDTWKPVPHSTVLDLVGETLEASGFRIEREKLGVTRDKARFFGTLDLKSELTPGVSLSVGVRNSTDKSLPLGFIAGSRVFVCDNLSFVSELMVARKHTRFGDVRFQEAISHAVGQLDQFQRVETGRIKIMQERVLEEKDGESILLRAFERGIIPARLMGEAIRQYRNPSYDWGSQDRAWHLYNAVTSAIQPRSRTNPQAFSAMTMAWTGMFFGNDGAALGSANNPIEV